MKSRKQDHKTKVSIGLKSLASHLGLSPGTISNVLNNAPAARRIPARTQERIFDAARQFNYRPNLSARSLRGRRTYTVGVIADEIGDGHGASVISGIEICLQKSDFSFVTVAHRHDEHLLRSLWQILPARGCEGVITIGTSVKRQATLPIVAVAGDRPVRNATNISLDHRRAARLVLEHLLGLGHHRIAFLRGSTPGSDSVARWKAIEQVAAELNVEILPELVLPMEDATTAGACNPAGQLLASGVRFTALVAYDEFSASRAIWAFRSAGLNVPRDISVVGYDDLLWASLSDPPLTTIRQPLMEMGRVAAQTLVDRIEQGVACLPEIVVAPELIVRESTGPAPRA